MSGLPRVPTVTSRLLAALVLLAACKTERREREPPAPVYDGDIEAILELRCGECHGAAADSDAGADAGASAFAIGSYLAVTACSDGARSVDPPDDRARLLRAIARRDHRGLLSADERERVERWVRGGAPLRASGVHAGGVLDPGSPEWHGRLATRDGFGPVLDADHAEACGRCHRGAPATPEGVRSGAPGATPCSDCHREPAGVLACTTCHGAGARAYPPRADCLRGPRGGAHAAHVEPGEIAAVPLTCGDCHPAATATLDGTHGDGRADVSVRAPLAGADARYDADTQRCAVACHARGGERPRPGWFEPGALGCGDCHGSPPEDHPSGACDGCHPGVDARGETLTSNAHHLDGRVDLGRGDGGEGCGACHGTADDPWPASGAHAVHRRSALTAEIACSDCHRVPDRVTAAGHLDGAPAEVTLAGRAAARGLAPRYEAGTCVDVACHGAGLPGAPTAAPSWQDAPTGACDSCHGTPPAEGHPASSDCASLVCHGGEIAEWPDGPRISESGRARHIDGAIDSANAGLGQDGD